MRPCFTEEEQIEEPKRKPTRKIPSPNIPTSSKPSPKTNLVLNFIASLSK
jgi:hypothetical protein